MQSAEQLRQQNLAMIDAWQQSGLSQKQYCLQNNIAYHIFHYWYKRYRDKQAGNGGDPAGFIPLIVNGASSTGYVELQFPDGKKILFHGPVSVDYLKAMIA
jgi:hypothetical protein